MKRKPEPMYDVVVLAPADFGLTDGAVAMRFRGLLRGKDGFHTIAFMSKTLPSVFGGLLAATAESGAPMPAPLRCSSAMATRSETSAGDLVLALELGPGAAIPVLLKRDSAQELFSALAAALAN